MKTDTDRAGMHCDEGFAERPRYFPRQPITAGDMTLEQDYFRNKLRRHNRLLHGWGVVCGARVCPVIDEDGDTEPWKVVVKPGYLLGPYGDEIMIDFPRCFDLRTRCITGITGDSCCERVDPWCGEVYRRPERRDKLFVAVRYKEVMTRPVRVHPVGCGCDETQCDYSRWRDGYEICVLDECPESHRGEPLDPGETGKLRDCPECPAEPWVVLAEVVVDEEGRVELIDNCSCRRNVFSLAETWWRCKTMRIDGIEGSRQHVGQDREMVLQGKNFSEGMRVTTKAKGIEIADIVRESDEKVKVIMHIADEVPAARYGLLIENADGSVIHLPEAIEVIRVEAAAPGGGDEATPASNRARRKTKKKKD